MSVLVDPNGRPIRKTSDQGLAAEIRPRVWAAIMVAVGSLATNVVTISSQGLSNWWNSALNSGTLRVDWRGERLPGLAFEARSDDGQRIVFSPSEPVRLVAKNYKITARQHERELPTRMLSHDGSEIQDVSVNRFRSASLFLEFNPTAPLFSRVYGFLEPELGAPISPPRRLVNVYQGFHETGIMIWIFDLNTFYILKSSDNSWVEIVGPPYPDDSCYYLQDCVDDKARAPDGLHAPIGGGYEVWEQFRDDIGWQLGHCVFKEEVTYERFENGFMIGPLQASPKNKTAVAIAVIDGGHDRSWRWPPLLESEPATCRPWPG